MILAVADIAGLSGLPTSNFGTRKWLSRNQVPTSLEGKRFTFLLSDLPAPVRLAWEARQIEAAGLPAGEYDDAAHAAFLDATPAMQAAALSKAGMARFLVARRDRMKWTALVAAAQAEFGPEGTSEATIRRILEDVQGVDPVNFAPALLPDCRREGRPRVPMTEAAWGFFVTTLRDAGPQFPLVQAWRDVRDVAAVRGWSWPPFVTVWRRWQALEPAAKLAARHGRETAIGALAQPVIRDKTTIGALEWVSLDGRQQDFWVDFGDGRKVRPTMLALVDVASNYILGYEMASSENALSTVRLIKRVCTAHGIFDRLYPDNGVSFAGHLVAGGTPKKFRGKQRPKPGVKPLGICHHLGIELHYALPKNAQAKIAERTFATISRVIDDRPEFKGARAGHKPGATPGPRVVAVPVETALAVIAREVARHNREIGRKSQGARGRSYEQVFRDSLASRIIRKPTAAQLYLAGLIYTPASVDRFGRLTVDTWTYGSQETQAKLLPWHGKGQVLLGRDPDDFAAPAMVFGPKGNLLCRSVPAVQKGVYGGVDGKRDAARNRKLAREAVAAAEAANNYLADAEFAAMLGDLPGDAIDPPTAPPKVVGGRFGGTLRKARNTPDDAAEVFELPRGGSFITEEHRRNLERAARGGAT